MHHKDAFKYWVLDAEFLELICAEMLKLRQMFVLYHFRLGYPVEEIANEHNTDCCYSKEYCQQLPFHCFLEN